MMLSEDYEEILRRLKRIKKEDRLPKEAKDNITNIEKEILYQNMEYGDYEFQDGNISENKEVEEASKPKALNNGIDSAEKDMEDAQVNANEDVNIKVDEQDMKEDVEDSKEDSNTEEDVLDDYSRLDRVLNDSWDSDSEDSIISSKEEDDTDISNTTSLEAVHENYKDISTAIENEEESIKTESKPFEASEDTIASDADSNNESYVHTKNIDALMNIKGLSDIDNISVSDEEKESDMKDFVFVRSEIRLKMNETDTHDGIDDEMVITIFPLNPKANDGNASIFSVAEHKGDYYYGSSYENKDGSSMVSLKIGEYEILTSGSFKDSVFNTRIFANGLLAQEGLRVVMEKEDKSEVPSNRLGLGHLKLKYQATEDIIGTVEAFPVFSSQRKTVWFIIRKASDFTDYTKQSDNIIYINTIDGDMVLDLRAYGGHASIDLVSKED